MPSLLVPPWVFPIGYPLWPIGPLAGQAALHVALALGIVDCAQLHGTLAQAGLGREDERLACKNAQKILKNNICE